MNRVSCSYYHTIHCETSPSCVEKNCIADTLKLIDRLQRQCQSKEKESLCTRCDKPFLGHRSTANTRPIILYLKNGDPFEIIYCEENASASHLIFRVEEVKGNCAVLRLLIPICPYHNEEINLYSPSTSKLYKVTQTCVTINLDDISAIQCLDDVHLNLKGCQY